MMAKRKKIKKAGSTSRNIHKIATTIGMVPLVTMSTYLFHDSYALALVSGVLATPKAEQYEMFDLSTFGTSPIYTSIPLSELFNDSTGYFLTGDFTSTAPNNIIEAYPSWNAVNFNLHQPGTTTVTINIINGSNQQATTKFVVSAYDPALVSSELDANNNGLDIGEIVNAASNQTANPAADLNGDGLVDIVDLNKLLGLIPSKYANHSPIAKPIADKNFIQGHNAAPINLDSYFSDQDGDHLNYRLYTAGPSVTGNINGSYLNFYISNTTLGSSNFTVVADDNHGGSKVVEFSADVSPSGTINTAPTVIWNQSTDLAVAGNVFDMNQMFKDVDSDLLTYSLSPDSESFFYSTYFPNNQLNLIYSTGVTGSHLLTITATDTYSSPSVSVTSSVYAERIADNFHVGYITPIEITSFLSGTTSHAIISSTDLFLHASPSFLTSTDLRTYLNIEGLSQGTYTVTISATTGSDTKYKTFIVPIYTMVT
jgi:hypothetical protein